MGQYPRRYLISTDISSQIVIYLIKTILYHSLDINFKTLQCTGKLLTTMVKLLPYKPEYSTNYYFAVELQNPDQTDLIKGHACVVYSYIDDIAIVAAIVKSCTKYNFTIHPVDGKQVYDAPNLWSINQAVQYLRRLRFFKKTVVKRTKTIEWNEEIEEEL